MRKISARLITDTVAWLCIQANINLRRDVYLALKKSYGHERNSRARRILKSLLDNADCARRLKLAICQDTGLPYVFVELGQKVQITGGDFVQAINKGIEQGYKKGKLRNSIIADPLRRNSTPGYAPGVIHIEMVRGSHLKLSVLPKGFGSENKTALKLFNPTTGVDALSDFIVQKVKDAGANACPPFVIGVGIGGGADQAMSLAKMALLRRIDKRNPDGLLAKLERELQKKINQLGIGPSGLGGETTCLGVNILTRPTHIAGLPVAVNISCHALRSAAKRL
ncbi:MAG: fumarate hydratase [Candidatus Omnitrophica bacterium]|nr:fumarate hydratase [Candidatus Omnitrophota bacterium]